MTDTGDVRTALAVLATMIGASLSWIEGLGVITVLFSVGLGAMLTYAVQTRTQNNAWKRESGLRKIDEIYGPLFNQINKISRDLSPEDGTGLKPGFGVIYSLDPQEPGWQAIKPSYRYYLIDDNLRKKLDDFFILLQELQNNLSRVNSMIDGKLLPHLRAAFGNDVEAALYVITAVSQNGIPTSTASYFLYEPLLTGIPPIEYFKTQNQKYPASSNWSDYDLELSLQRSGTIKPVFGPKSPNPEARRQFDELVSATSKEVREDPLVLVVDAETEELKVRANQLKDELRNKIEEPWRT
jgi:hypothetical protein